VVHTIGVAHCSTADQCCVFAFRHTHGIRRHQPLCGPSCCPGHRRHPNHNANRYPIAHTHANPHTYADRHLNTNVDTDSDSHAHADGNANPNLDADPYPNAYSDAYSDAVVADARRCEP